MINPVALTFSSVVTATGIVVSSAKTGSEMQFCKHHTTCTHNSKDSSILHIMAPFLFVLVDYSLLFFHGISDSISEMNLALLYKHTVIGAFTLFELAIFTIIT